MRSKNQEIPIIGKEYYFFDDGKTSPSRCYKARVLNVFPYNTKINVEVFDYDIKQKIIKPIQEVHKQEVDKHRQGDNFKVLGGDTTTGAPWLYAEETDYFIECEIPGYDEDHIWFARTINGGWFSFDLTNSWQSGTLDVDNSIYNDVIDCYGKEWYDEALRIKGELIE